MTNLQLNNSKEEVSLSNGDTVVSIVNYEGGVNDPDAQENKISVKESSFTEKCLITAAIVVVVSVVSYWIGV